MRELQLRFRSRLPAHWFQRLLCLAAILAQPVGAQLSPQQPRPPMPQPIGQKVGNSIDDPGGNGDFAEEEERLRALNRERQKSLVSDTNKLLKLATELDMEIKSADANSLTPSQLHKLASIEKLAHDVKDKMSYSVRGPAMMQPALPTQIR
jgi:hypothetical protein